MRSLLAIAIAVAACGAPAGTTIPVDAAELTEAGDGATPTDAAHQVADASAPPDLAQAADLAECGRLNGPCCDAQICVDAHFAEGAYCTGGCALAGTAWAGCRMLAGVPTCLPCGLVGQICCATSPRCVGGVTCAGPSSANAGYCP